MTGEDATFKSPTPTKNFDPQRGGWGAWESVARHSFINLDDDLFPTFADSGELPNSAVTLGLGLNLYLNRNIRASFNYSRTDSKGGKAGGDADMGENALLIRVQLVF